MCTSPYTRWTKPDLILYRSKIYHQITEHFRISVLHKDLILSRFNAFREVLRNCFRQEEFDQSTDFDEHNSLQSAIIICLIKILWLLMQWLFDFSVEMEQHRRGSSLAVVLPILFIGIAITAATHFACTGDEVPGIIGMVSSMIGLENHRADETGGGCISAFQIDLDDPLEIDAANRALSLIRDTYHRDFTHSKISHHHFVRTAPQAIQDTLSEFVWNDAVLARVRSQFGEGPQRQRRRSQRGTTSAAAAAAADGKNVGSNNGGSGGVRVIPDVFDEIYIMRPEFDWVDDKKVHYDGNLKFPGICTVRALTYLSGQDATLFALTTRANYTTRSHTSIVLDFDREMHFVVLRNRNSTIAMNDNATAYRETSVDRVPFSESAVKSEGMMLPPGPDDEPRVMIKSALHVILPGTHHVVARFRIMLHRTMVFGARCFRRAFESKAGSPPHPDGPSKSDVAMMAVDNLMRSLNKIHVLLPVLLIGLPLAAVFIALLIYPYHFVPYIVIIATRFLNPSNPIGHILSSRRVFLMASAIYGVWFWKSRSSTRINEFQVMHVMGKKDSSAVATTASSSLAPPDSPRFRLFCLLCFHIAWIGICFYIGANVDMANNTLLAPWQQVVHLDDIL